MSGVSPSAVSGPHRRGGSRFSQNSSPVDVTIGSSRVGKDIDRTGRSASKGRRRRAAQEMRRVEQMCWDQVRSEQHGLDDVEDDYMEATANQVLTPGGSRRRMRRSRRRHGSHGDMLDELVTAEHELMGGADEGLALAMALSLSLTDTSSSVESSFSVASSRGSIDRARNAPDMSYEELVALESVSCVLPDSVVDLLQVTEIEDNDDILAHDDVCAICLGEYVEADHVLHLPCRHCFHEKCGREWLLRYSKFCPVCKQCVQG
eukprot:TRINITY_DN3075_c0_g1_i1.p1 TRINITY_DN3075_c0_g1~~TRINITY_DN3075_c0_g1_i1.p1  ORF type:complete len:262 (+),score=21.85 TRINITY_DN3075_c0_g1_i1:348-1133(+)